jgi:hypothetical protein
MKRSMMIMRAAGVMAAIALTVYPSAAKACAVCMSGADSHNGDAINGAIFLMLGFLGTIFACIGGVVYSFIRRARAPLPPHAQFTDSLPPVHDPLS